MSIETARELAKGGNTGMSVTIFRNDAKDGTGKPVSKAVTVSYYNAEAMLKKPMFTEKPLHKLAE